MPIPLQNGAYLALSRKFCGQVNIHSTINFFFAGAAKPQHSQAIVRNRDHRSDCTNSRRPDGLHIATFNADPKLLEAKRLF